jgi:hypothetical protein
MVRKYRYLILFLGLTNTIYAGEPAATPDEELLQFLADWETENGEWLAPEQLQQMPELAIQEVVHNEDED